MRFTKPWTEYVQPGGGSVWRPALQMLVRTVDGWETYRFLVDSGADLSMAPSSLFRLLGKRWEEGEPRVLRGISRRKECAVEGRVHDVDILIPDVARGFVLPICFARAEVPFLIGRDGFFDSFEVSFDKPRRLTHFVLAD